MLDVITLPNSGHSGRIRSEELVKTPLQGLVHPARTQLRKARSRIDGS